MGRHLSYSEWTRVLEGDAGIDLDAATAHLKRCSLCWERLRGHRTELAGHSHVLDLWHNLLARVESRGLTDHKLLEARDFAMAAFAKAPARPKAPPAPSRVPARRLLHVQPAAPVGHLAPGDYKKTLEHRDRQLIAAALTQCQGRMGETCRLLGISEPTLRDKMKKYRLKNRI